jgi:hypothetical protein
VLADTLAELATLFGFPVGVLLADLCPVVSSASYLSDRNSILPPYWREVAIRQARFLSDAVEREDMTPVILSATARDFLAQLVGAENLRPRTPVTTTTMGLSDAFMAALYKNAARIFLGPGRRLIGFGPHVASVWSTGTAIFIRHMLARLALCRFLREDAKALLLPLLFDTDFAQALAAAVDTGLADSTLADAAAAQLHADPVLARAQLCGDADRRGVKLGAALYAALLSKTTAHYLQEASAKLQFAAFYDANAQAFADAAGF